MQYRCPLCQTNGVVPDKARGHEVLCLKCREHFFIPDQSLEERVKLGIFVAARRNDGEVIIALAESGANLDVQEEESGHTPLHIASFYGKLYAGRELIQQGASLEIRASKTVQTPLFYAARENNPKIVRWLLERGAEPNCQDPDGTTPLHWAARKGFLEVAKVLVAGGADYRVENHIGLRPLQFAVSYHQPELRDFLISVERATKFFQNQRTKTNSKTGTLNKFLFGFGEK
ncbi:Ankyrin repeat protein [Bremerella volcania]|uniref:Ankyrin repeat protein n=1 Tax=Bremerella volcania TaxID=2527984 RepID=A0A518C903_9BACT|nr:ankyrin repeat domain-containing protein [Bremerella volcania]QDU75706.1 Ankyrin repeat protein [Bremerella volcania]